MYKFLDSGMENGTAGDDDFNMVTDVNEYSQVTRIPSKILLVFFTYRFCVKAFLVFCVV